MYRIEVKLPEQDENATEWLSVIDIETKKNRIFEDKDSAETFANANIKDGHWRLVDEPAAD
jgi:hypothetical protein